MLDSTINVNGWIITRHTVDATPGVPMFHWFSSISDGTARPWMLEVKIPADIFMAVVATWPLDFKVEQVIPWDRHLRLNGMLKTTVITDMIADLIMENCNG